MLAGPILSDTGGPVTAITFGCLGLFFGWVARKDWQARRPTPLDPLSSVKSVLVPVPVRWIAALFVILGAGLLFDAFRLPRLRNVDAYLARYDQLGLQESDTEKFHQLRREFLTCKTQEEDYGATLVICGILLPVAFVWYARRHRRFPTRGKVLLHGMLAALASTLSGAAEVIFAQSRGEFPWWADSIIIPLVEVAATFLVMLAWVSGHAFLTERDGGRSRGPGFRLIKGWLVFEALFAAFVLASAIITGDFLVIASRAIWFGFFSAVLRSHLRTGRVIAF